MDTNMMRIATKCFNQHKNTEETMNIDRVIAALNSGLRREILKIIAERPMTAVEVFRELKRRKPEIRYRETVYRALERLSDADLVEKYYAKEKGLCYKISVINLSIDLTSATVRGTTVK